MVDSIKDSSNINNVENYSMSQSYKFRLLSGTILLCTSIGFWHEAGFPKAKYREDILDHVKKVFQLFLLINYTQSFGVKNSSYNFASSEPFSGCQS